MNLIERLNDLIKELKNENMISTSDISDTHHTIGDLYKHRCILFSVICNQNKDISWKSKLHSDGTMYDDMFIVGIKTLKGQATYHYDMEFWDMFKVKEIDNAPEWDGYSPEDVLERLQSLSKTYYELEYNKYL